MLAAKTRLPSAYDTNSYCPLLPSELKMRSLRNMTLNRTTYVKASNIKVKLELAEIGAEIEKKNSLFTKRLLEG